jgi:hypothetical protein
VLTVLLQQLKTLGAAWCDEFVAAHGDEALAKVTSRCAQRRRRLADDADVTLDAALDCLLALSRQGHATALCAVPQLSDALRATLAPLTADAATVTQPRVLRLLGSLCHAAQTAGAALLQRIVVDDAPPPPPPPTANGGDSAAAPPPLPVRVTREACRPLYWALKAHGPANEAKAISLELINTLIANQASLDDSVAMRMVFLKLGLLKSRTRLRTECKRSKRSGGDGDNADDDGSSDSDDSSSTDVDDEDESSSSLSGQDGETLSEEAAAQRWAKRLRRALSVFEDHMRRDDYELLHYGRRETRNAYLDATAADSPAMTRRAAQRGTSPRAASDDDSSTESNASGGAAADEDEEQALSSDLASTSSASEASTGVHSPRRRKRHSHRPRLALSLKLSTRPSGTAPAPPGLPTSPPPTSPSTLAVPGAPAPTSTTPRDRNLLRVVIVSPLARDAAVRTALPIHADLEIAEVVEHLLSKFPNLVGDDDHALFVPSAAMQQQQQQQPQQQPGESRRRLRRRRWHDWRAKAAASGSRVTRSLATTRLAVRR